MEREKALRNPISLWYEAQKIIVYPQNKNEYYYSNWFQMTLPKKIQVHRGDITVDYFEELKKTGIVFVEHSKNIVTFSSKYEVEKFITLNYSFEFNTEDFINLESIKVNDKIDIAEPRYLLIRLLNSIFKVFLYKCGLTKYENVSKSSKKRNIFHFKNTHENRKMISLKSIGKTRRNVIGKTHNFVWFYGISYKATLEPFIGYKISHHLVFTDNNGKYLS